MMRHNRRSSLSNPFANDQTGITDEWTDARDPFADPEGERDAVDGVPMKDLPESREESTARLDLINQAIVSGT